MQNAKKILIVEDEYFLAEQVKERLDFSKIQSEWAETAEEALLKIKNSDYQLVLLDIMLPGMSGIELAKKLRADQKFKTLPIIAMTARGRPEDREEALEVGFTDYVVKPFEWTDLIDKIKEYL